LFAPQNELSLIIQILALVTNKVTNKTIKLLLSLKSRMTSPRHQQPFAIQICARVLWQVQPKTFK
jgi:hypothetical protein